VTLDELGRSPEWPHRRLVSRLFTPWLSAASSSAGGFVRSGRPRLRGSYLLRATLSCYARANPTEILDDISHSTSLHQESKSSAYHTLAEPDPERRYYQGTIMAFCGKPDIALHMIKAAIDQNYCSYSALLSDPLLAKLRSSKEFDQVLTAARECQQSVRNPS
jgi:hypothetical protein